MTEAPHHEGAAQTISVVLADDHPLFLDEIEKLLCFEPGFKVLARCASGDEALSAVRALKPDVLVLGARLPGKDGIETLRDVSRERLPTRVVLLTAVIKDDEVLEAIRLGAGGVVLKEMVPRLLVPCVRKAHAGGPRLEKGSFAQVLSNLLRREAPVPRASGTLSARETEIVRLAARGFQNKDIADNLGISPGTVKIHLHHIYGKLDVAGRIGLMRFAENNGLL